MVRVIDLGARDGRVDGLFASPSIIVDIFTTCGPSWQGVVASRGQIVAGAGFYWYKRNRLDRIAKSPFVTFCKVINFARLSHLKISPARKIFFKRQRENGEPGRNENYPVKGPIH